MTISIPFFSGSLIFFRDSSNLLRIIHLSLFLQKGHAPLPLGLTFNSILINYQIKLFLSIPAKPTQLKNISIEQNRSFFYNKNTQSFNYTLIKT